MSDPDFSKLFGSSATSISDWTDPNYLKGWGFLGQANPPYELFDALQKQNDTKLKWLFDKLDGMFRLNSTAYVVGDTITSESMASYIYAECTVAGTTGTSEPTWGTTIGATVTDGTVTWSIRRKGNNIPYNQQIYSTAGTYTFTAPVDGLYKVTVIGGGGAGGGAMGTATYSAGGGGGAGGGTAIKRIYLAKSTAVTVTVGSGGVGAGSGTDNTAAASGNTSSFGAYCSAGGGVGGFSAKSSTSNVYRLGGAGVSIGANGDLNINGGSGSSSINIDSTGNYGSGGAGGSTYISGGASRTGTTAANGINGIYGGGGGGAKSTSTTDYTGGSGGTGICIVEW